MENTEAQVDQVNSPPENVGTSLFGMYGPGFKKGIKALTKGELQRLIRAVCFDGMEEPEFGNDHNQDLPALISLAKSFVEAKFVLSMNAAFAAQKSAEATADNATETEGNEVNGEINS